MKAKLPFLAAFLVGVGGGVGARKLPSMLNPAKKPPHAKVAVAAERSPDIRYAAGRAIVTFPA